MNDTRLLKVQEPKASVTTRGKAYTHLLYVMYPWGLFLHFILNYNGHLNISTDKIHFVSLAIHWFGSLSFGHLFRAWERACCNRALESNCFFILFYFSNFHFAVIVSIELE